MIQTNNNIFYFFYNFSHQSKSLDNLIIFLAQYLPYLVILSSIFYLLLHHEVIQKTNNPFDLFIKTLKQKWQEIVLVFFSGISAWCVAEVLKFLFHTRRPYLKLENIYPLISKTDFSFPSGHATFFMALAFAIFLSHKRAGLSAMSAHAGQAGYVFIFFAIVIGLARITAGVHFPVDILGGFVLGIGVAYIVRYFYR